MKFRVFAHPNDTELSLIIEYTATGFQLSFMDEAKRIEKTDTATFMGVLRRSETDDNIQFFTDDEPK